jgi:hypothetical protein
VRLVLATINAVGLCCIRHAVSRRFGRPTGLYYTLLTCSQFHVPFWMGRTLPNMFALLPGSGLSFLVYGLAKVDGQLTCRPTSSLTVRRIPSNLRRKASALQSHCWPFPQSYFALRLRCFWQLWPRNPFTWDTHPSGVYLPSVLSPLSPQLVCPSPFYVSQANSPQPSPSR